MSQELIERALQFQQAGDFAQAEAICGEIVRDEPNHVEAWNLLGVFAFQTGRLDAALERFEKAMSLAPGEAVYHSNRGAVLQRLGRPADAETEYREALRLNPHYADAHNNLCVLLRARGSPIEAEVQSRLAVRLLPESPNARYNLGLALYDQRRFEECIVEFREALRLRPDYPEACNSLGHLLGEMGQQEEAEELFRRAVKLAPGNAEYHSNLSVILERRGQVAEAEAEGRAALQLQPNSPEALNNLGNTLSAQGRAEEALALFRRAIHLRPDFGEAHNNLGNVLMLLHRNDEAVGHFRQALDLLPNFADAHNNLGNVLGDMDRLDEAEQHLRRAIELKPDYVQAYDNLGRVLLDEGRSEESLVSFDKALELKPDFPMAHKNRAIVRLLLGDYERGLAEYDERWRLKDCKLPGYQQPMWDGSSLDGKTILLHPEQGLGDMIHFVRYARFVKERGGRVILHCPERLLEILRGVQGIDELVPLGEPPPAFDVFAPLLSLPRIFGTTVETIPAPIPYLTADPKLIDAWRERLAAIPGFKIGIAWQGDPKYYRDRQRSVPLRLFAPLARVPGVTLISLQKGPGVEQLATLQSQFPVLDWGAELDEATGPFLDTAALLTALDLVISVDTVTVHLAGALGVRTWLAQSFIPHWPWLFDRDVSPWYPTVRLFRQRRRGEWGEVFARMAHELAEVVSDAAGARPIRVEVAPGELLDKITILEIKSERLTDAEKLRNTRIELDELTRARDRCLPTSAELAELTAELKRINELLWEVEDSLRDLERAQDFGTRFVELARSVYRTNDRRAAVKRRINELLGSRIVEEKSYRRY